MNLETWQWSAGPPIGKRGQLNDALMSVTDPLWYKDAILYQVHVSRSFSDSFGHGHGDFQGLSQKLDYLQDLGITAVWLFTLFTRRR